MKKIIVLFVLFLFSVMPVFAEYKPIPAHLSKQYKAEIESYIDTQYPLAKNEIEQIAIEAKDLRNKVIQNPKNYDLYMEFCAKNYESYIDTPIFDVYVGLIDITQKYAKFSDDEKPATDFTGALHEFLNPYFKNNNINITKLITLNKFVIPKFNLIEQYETDTHKAMYPEEY